MSTEDQKELKIKIDGDAMRKVLSEEIEQRETLKSRVKELEKALEDKETEKQHVQEELNKMVQKAHFQLIWVGKEKALNLKIAMNMKAIH